MAKNDQNRKSGLHKDISSIFDGVPVPTERTGSGPKEPRQGQPPYDSPRPPAYPPQNPQIPGHYQRPGRAAAPASEGALQQVTKKLFGKKSDADPGRQKIMLILVPILLVVLVVQLGKVVDIPFLTTTKPAPPKPEDTTSAVVAKSQISWQKPALYPEGLRDPMQLTAEMARQIQIVSVEPVEIGKPTVGPLTVKGIVYSPDNPSAVIGTRIAHVGDIIEGARVMEIKRDGVVFEKDGETFTKTVEP